MVVSGCEGGREDNGGRKGIKQKWKSWELALTKCWGFEKRMIFVVTRLRGIGGLGRKFGKRLIACKLVSVARRVRGTNEALACSEAQIVHLLK